MKKDFCYSQRRRHAGIVRRLPADARSGYSTAEDDRLRLRGVKLNLGCSDQPFAGFINVDRVPPADQIADLDAPWPWPDSSVDEIRAWDIIEHLPDKVATMNEAWRVLKPGGIFDIEVPTTDGPGAWQDPTHVSYWNRNSFLYYTAGDPHRERFGNAYGVAARFTVATEVLTRPGGVAKLRIILEAVK